MDTAAGRDAVAGNAEEGTVGRPAYDAGNEKGR